MFRHTLLLAIVLALPFATHSAADEAESLSYRDSSDPWFPHKDTPKLITPQWVGDEGVEAVIVLAIDDMRDPAKYELYLRPILNRLKQIDGRAPVSIMTCDVKPDDPQLQSWLGEGLSIECHTIDHPCPLFHGGDGLKKVSGTLEAPESSRHLFQTPFAKAKSTYDRCVDLMGRIPGNKPVAFRTPCCDSLNTVSPRFYSEIFNKQTEHGNFLLIDSSVFTFFTSEDGSLPRDLVLDANGNERFLKYLPKGNNYGGNVHNNFVNDIRNYPYPWVINNSCWQIPCLAPSDWSAQHLHGVNNPITVEDWKAAIDLTVHKQGCFSLVFHPHGWIKPEQVVELIDHAVSTHGTKVKFLNFAEVAGRLGDPRSEPRRVEPARATSAGPPISTSPLPRAGGEGQGEGAAERTVERSALPPAVSALIKSDPALADWWAGAAPVAPYGLRPIRRDDGTHNGFFIRDGHFCWINEDTDKLPDLMHRVSFEDVMAAANERPQASGGRQPTGTRRHTVSMTQDRGADAAPLANESRDYSAVPIGAAVIDITPDYPTRLTGYGSRTQEATTVAARIHARALAIGSPNVVSLLITVDNCGVPLELTEAIHARIAAKHNVPRERFAICSTHTHSAPWLRGFAPNIFASIPDEHAANLVRYEQELIDKLVTLVDDAVAAQRPGHLSVGYGATHFAINRRALANGQWSGFGETPDGPVDSRVPVLAAHDTNGKLIAVLANYACHCTTETGEFNEISGDWAGHAADMLEADHPGAVALIAIGCGADANPSPRSSHELAVQHGRTMADEVKNVLASSAFIDLANGGRKPTGAPVEEPAPNKTGRLTPAARQAGQMRPINPVITCNLARIDLPLANVLTKEQLVEQSTDPGVPGSRARYFLEQLEQGHNVPTTVPDYPVQTWCFGDDLAMVFLGGEVVVDYSLRINRMFDSDRLWINAYSNDVPCYIASARILREGGYEADSSMMYYRRPGRLAPETEDLICDTVQKLLPHSFYSEALQQEFPAPKSPAESLQCMTTRAELRIVLAAAEPLIRDPVAFDWDERGRLWVVEMGDYPSVPDTGTALAAGFNALESQPRASALSLESHTHSGRIRILEDLDGDFVYDKATTFLDNLAFPNGIHCWRGGVIVTMAPDIFFAEDTDSDNVANRRETLYSGFTEGNQQHRVNGLRWGLDGWLYLANGDSGGEIRGTGYIPGDSASRGRNPTGTTAPTVSESQRTGGLTPSARQSVALRGRDLRINADTNEFDAVSGQSQFGRERDDFGNWFGNNNSNPIWQYVIEDRYVRRNPHAAISNVTANVSVIPGAAPVYPTSRTLARFNDFGQANRFTSACSTMIYRDVWLGEQFYGNAFTCEPVHNLVSRLVLTRDGYGFKGERATDEQQSEFLASSDHWFRPVMARTGPDGALWIADMYRAVIEHPEWIPAEYQRKMNLYAGHDRGRLYRVVPASDCCGDEASDLASGGSEPAGLLSPLPRAGGEGQGEEVAVLSPTAAESDTPSSGLPATFSPDLGGEGTSRRFFSQPWHAIPIPDLIDRLASPNGWWRDTAQRILLHRKQEVLAARTTLPLELFGDQTPPAVRAHTIAVADDIIGETNDPAAMIGLSDSSADVRKVSIQLLEPALRKDAARIIAALAPLTDDADPGVRLQLLLSLGEASGDSAATLLGRMLRENSADERLVNAGLTSLTPGNIGGVLQSVISEPASDELIAILLAQAARMGRTQELIAPLETLIGSLATDSPPDRFMMVGSLVSDLRRKLGDAWERHESLPLRTAQARQVALEVARQSEADSGRRAAAIRLLTVTIDDRLSSDVDATEWLSSRQPQDVQLATLELLAERPAADFVAAIAERWLQLESSARTAAIRLILQRRPTTNALLDAIKTGTIEVTDIDATHRDALLHHRDSEIARRAESLLAVTGSKVRSAVVDDFNSQISNRKSDAVAGRAVFEKRCATCHRLQDLGKDIGADLAALKDRSTDALLTAILDPNRAVESKFLTYTVVTKDGLQHSGMIKGETGGGLTLVGSDGREVVILRAEIDELLATRRSLMPEGLENDLSPQNLADVIAFVQSTETPWKRFDGNSPQLVEANADGTLTLPATAAEIRGPSLVFEPHYANLGYWCSTDDVATWTIDVPQSGHWIVEFDLACDNSTSGGLVRLSTGNRLLTARVPGTGSWDNYQTWRAGTIDLHRGRATLTVTAPEAPPSALMDLRAIRLLPPEKE